jgi:hypothetical protein
MFLLDYPKYMKSNDHSMMFFPNVKGNTSCNQLMLILHCLGGKGIFFKNIKRPPIHLFSRCGMKCIGKQLDVFPYLPKKKQKTIEKTSGGHWMAPKCFSS